MAFFFESVKKIIRYLETRNEDRELIGAFDKAFHEDHARIEHIWRKTLLVDYSGKPHYTLWLLLPGFQSDDVKLALAEQWRYPGVDLLRWIDRQYPYDTREPPAWIRDPYNATTPINVWNWQARLLAIFSAGDQKLRISMDYNVLPWNSPRQVVKLVSGYAQHLKGNGEPVSSRRQIEREFLQELQDITSEIGDRVWHIPVESDITADNLHAQLVICGWRQGFPIEREDEALAIKVVERIVTKIGRDSSPEDIKEFTSECLGHLMKRFDFPTSPGSLPAYIASIVKVMIASKRRERTYESFQLASGPTYSVPQATIRIRAEIIRAFEPEFKDIWIPSEKTLYSWLKAKKIESERGKDGSVVFTEQGLQAAIDEVRTCNARKRALARGEARGLSDDRTKQIIHRHRKPDGSPDWGHIDQKIDAASPVRTRVRAQKMPKGER